MKLKLLVFLLLSIPMLILAQDAPEVIHLWTNGAPGFESRRDIPEIVEGYRVRNINDPSITVFLPPKDKATGAAVVICPGGGFHYIDRSLKNCFKDQ